MCAIVLHSVDISNPTRISEASKMWFERISKEFYDQGIEEKNLNLTVSPGCDEELFNKKVGAYEKFTLGFINFLVYPI